LDSLDQKYQKILFVVSIYQGRKNNQHFSMVDNAFIRAVDAKGKEITKYSLSGDATLNGKCTMVFQKFIDTMVIGNLEPLENHTTQIIL
jgi:tellurium resistance protein TerD